MRVIIPILGLSVFVALFANTGRKIYQWLRPLWGGVGPLLYGIIYGVLIVAVLASFVVSRMPDNGVPRIIFTIGHHALGFLVYVVMLVNIVALLLFLCSIIRLIPTPLPQRAGLATGAAVLLLAAGLSIYGAVHGLQVQTRSYEVQLRGTESAAETDSLQIALISDLHLGYIVEENHLARIVAAVNATSPDIVCLAGDIFDGDMTALANPEKLQSLFLEMDASHGVYACLGNHDAGASYEGMLEFLSGAGVQVLRDEAVVIDGRVVLAGRRDSSPIGSHGDERVELILPADADNLPVIVMDHQPSNIREYGESTGLILSGHTHKGQMFPFNLITNAMFDVDYGYYQVSETGLQAIVTSGAGTWGPPQRVGTDSEIAAIRVEFPSQVAIITEE